VGARRRDRCLHFAPRRRLDETAAARKPILRWRRENMPEAAE
jgi:glycine dehydrogenase subunit 2